MDKAKAKRFIKTVTDRIETAVIVPVLFILWPWFCLWRFAEWLELEYENQTELTAGRLLNAIGIVGTLFWWLFVFACYTWISTGVK